ncbi:MAG: Bug family tripartite tricarboxylate transporter substrate binding protein [Burkholderiales bacterium]
MRHIVRFVSAATFAAVIHTFAGAVRAQDYPVKPIRLYSPLPAGGMVDNFARALAQHFSESLKQPVTVENRTGASGTLAAEATARASADGYTLLLATQAILVLNPYAQKNLSYDPQKDFTPVSPLFYTPLYVIVHPSVPANSVKELIALARSQPGKLAFASIGQGTSVHLATEIFMSMTNTEMIHVPYKGTGPANIDLLAGRVQVMFSGGGTGLPPVRAGKLKLLASTAERRTIATPETPTVAEAGVAGYESIAWFALVGPAGLPRSIVERLHRETAVMQKSPTVVDTFAKAGAEMLPGTPAELAARIRREQPLFAKVMKDAGIVPE